MVINRIAPLSLAKISGTLYAALGVIFGAFFSLFATVGAAAGGGNSMFPAIFGVGAIVLFPIFYGCIGFVGSLVGAWLYNLLAGMVGGIELDVT
jgi:hypothetical protein